MNKYLEAIIDGYTGYAGYLWQEIVFGYTYKPWWENYFYWLILVSLFFFGVELLRPWRKEQPRFRKDFWLDTFYMFFNFFLFSLIIYNAASNVVVLFFNDILAVFGLKNLVAITVDSFPIWGQLLLLFVLRDFIQWNIHRLLHRVPFLWEFHKVHHSVEQMGFAAHLRYHWMETIVYNTIQYLPLAMIGFGIDDFFVVHIFALAVGHYNHSNISIDGKITGGIVATLFGLLVLSSYPDLVGQQQLGIILLSTLVGIFALGPLMKYLFNSPEMHIWHHAYQMPESHPYGINFGLSLAIWDYIFGTAHVPHSGRDIKLGFEGIEEFPTDFKGQILHGFGNTKQ